MMSRRDTIIIAVLVNTGLLAVLFLMAMHTEPHSGSQPIDTPTHYAESTTISTQPEQPAKQQTAHIALRDEIDQVITSYSAKPVKPEVIIPPDQPIQQTPTKPSYEVSQPNQDPFVEVTVKRGDSLDKIARANGTTVTAIMRANHLTNSRIDIGQVLRIPHSSKAAQNIPPPAPVAKPKKEIAELEPEYYTMKSGDNPWKIAKQFRVRFDELLKMNDLDEEKARNLKPGDVLRVK